jgi:prepilin-type N-terminal cleavage/methylation domain-containing protein/prepilin-type processing-associated H-X9-DG protein
MTSPLLHTNPSPKRSGFTVVEVLVTVAIIAVLAAVSFSLFESAIESKHRTVCSQRLLAIGRALQLYVLDHNGFYPPIRDNRANGSTWYGTRTLYPYFEITDKERATQKALGIGPAATLYECPSGEKGNHFTMTTAFRDWSNGWPGNRLAARRANTVSRPSQTILFYEAVDGSKNDLIWSAARADINQSHPSKTKALAFRHGGTMQTLRADGHIQGVNFQNRSEITQSMWEGREIP